MRAARRGDHAGLLHYVVATDPAGEIGIVADVTRTMTKCRSLVAWEMALLFASILVFRSAWTLLDRWDWAGSTSGLTALLVLGSGLCVVAFRAINKS